MILLRVACVLSITIAENIVPLNEPFQIAMPSDDHKSLVEVNEGLSKLAQHAGDIALVSVVGPFHSGKSFLLNALANSMKTFPVGRKTSPETMGIWVCRTDMKAKDGAEVWLMDSEGFYAPGVDEGYDAKVFTVASLLGAHIIYNTIKVIDQQAVNLLEMLVRRAQLFRTRTSVSTVEVPDFLRLDSFPPLTWVLEDFVQELPSALQYEGPTGWLKTYLKHAATPGVDGQVDFLHSLYKEVRVHTLFLPATTKEHLQDLSKLRLSELNPEFQTELDQLRSHLTNKLEARGFQGRKMSGSSLSNALRFMLKGLRDGMFHELPSVWESWTLHIAEVSLDDAEKWFGALAQEIDKKQEPLITISVFNERLLSAREKVIEFYKSMLKDFNISPNLPDLQRRMDMQLSPVIQTYHDRVRRWIGDFSAHVNEEYKYILAEQQLPTDTQALDTAGQHALSSFVANFTGELKAFSYSAGGKDQVKMPNLVEDPVNHLTSALTAKLVARQFENERQTQTLFKKAVDAADYTVSRELNQSSDRLYTKRQVSEISNELEKRCKHILHEHLSKYAWAESSPHYRTNRALLEDQFRGRVAQFSAENDKRLDVFFRDTLHRIRDAYASSVKVVILPATEGNIDNEHNGFAERAKTQWKSNAGNFSDTKPFEDGTSRLNGFLDGELKNLKAKNIELWKIHSDEATRCAVAANNAVSARCGWFCMYKWFPWSHKRVARQNLKECFAKTRSSIDGELQLQVFLVWYDKDLAHEADAVWVGFKTLSTTMLVFIGFGLYQYLKVEQPAAYMQYVQPQPPRPHGYVQPYVQYAQPQAPKVDYRLAAQLG